MTTYKAKIYRIGAEKAEFVSLQDKTYEGAVAEIKEIYLSSMDIIAFKVIKSRQKVE